MNITLNVLITLTAAGKIFSVWAEQNRSIPGIELNAGCGFTISDAVEDWYDNQPSIFFIDDETVIYKDSFSYRLKRPFVVERGESPRILQIC